MMKQSIVFMFHAIGSDKELLGSDPHYSFSLDKFEQFIRQCGGCRSLKDSISGDAAKNIITFDDGHISNFKAAQIINDTNGGTADFFINPNTVSTPNFLSWSQLQEMNNMGMSIQSHSLDHLYLSDMTIDEQRRQLEVSKKTIEDKLGVAVTILAPPGGRFNQETIRLCHELGYEHLSVSEPGRWSGSYISKRIAVYQNTKVKELLGCNKALSAYLINQTLKYRVTGVAKSVFGNRSYDIMRSKILGSAP